MNSNSWKEIAVAELGRIVTGKTPPTKDAGNFGNDYPFITPVDMNGEKHIYRSSRGLSEIGKRVIQNYLLPKDSISVSCIGSDLGKVVKTTRDSFTNQQINSIVCNESFDPDFVYYALTFISPQLRSVGHHSTAVPIINKSDFSKFKVKAPNSKETQRKISSVLSSLDDKIELNRQTNQTLEAIAQALFKEWFVDFKFRGATGEMVDSELGEIPRGWSVQKLRQIIEIKNGYAFKGTDFIDSGVPVIKIKNVKAGRITLNTLSYVSREVADKADRFKINYNDILISMSGNRIDGSPDTWVGKVALFNKEGEYLLNQRVSKLKIKDDTQVSKYFVTQLLSSEVFQYYFISIATSSGGQANISPDFIYNTDIVIPPKNLMDEYHKEAQPLYDLISNRQDEIETLSQLRDDLLPKLMKGEIEIT